MHYKEVTAQDLDQLCQVVWFYNPGSHVARRPGTFSENLIRTFGHADVNNFMRLSLAFPVYAHGVGLAMGMGAVTEDGLGELIELCEKAGEALRG